MKSYLNLARAFIRLDTLINRYVGYLRRTDPGTVAEQEALCKIFRFMMTQDRLYSLCLQRDEGEGK